MGQEMEAPGRNRNRSWWQQRTRLEKKGIILLGIAILIILALIIAFCIVSGKVNDGSKNKSDTICLTPACVKAASALLQNIDQTVNPCDDFYEFACGSYIKNNYIPEDKTDINSFNTIKDTVQRQVRDILEETIKPNEARPFVLTKKFYKFCMNISAVEADGLNTVKRILKKLGGWPVLEGQNWNENNFDWRTSIYKFRKIGINTDHFITFGLEPDARNSSLWLIQLDEAEVGKTRDYLLRGFGSPFVTAYLKYITDVMQYFGADAVSAELEARSIVEFRINLAKLTIAQEERRDPKAMFNPMSVEELQERYRSIPWTELLNNIINSPGETVSPTTEVNVKVPKYIEQLDGLLYSTSKRIQANHAFFHAVNSLVGYLPDEIINKQQQLVAVVSGTSVRPPRWSECTDKTMELFYISVGALYVRKHFPESTKEEVSKMVIDIKNELIRIIEKLDWMDSNTKKIAIEKASFMETFIGYPVEFLDDKKVEEFYANLHFSNDNYLEAGNQLNLLEQNLKYSFFNEFKNRSDWRTRVPTVTINAGYMSQENSMQLPAAILQSVFYDKDRPQYMNYGAMGYIIGHEVTHGFDDQGKQFNKYGGLENWWANETNAAYAERAKCFVKQYSNYVVPELGINLNGANTQGENIADNGGIKEAYLAYISWVKRNAPELTLPGVNYTAKQLFWIATANCWCSMSRKEMLEYIVLGDVHAPNRFRVNVPFGNIHYFAEDFNCPTGSKMVQKDKCEIW